MSEDPQSIVLLSADVEHDDLPRYREVSELPDDVRCVIVRWREDFGDVVAALRQDEPERRILAWFDTEQADHVSAALEGGADELIFAADHLDRRLRSLRSDVATAQSAAERRESYDAMVTLIQEISAHPELQEVLRVSILRMSKLLNVDQTSVVLFNPGDEFGFVVAERDRKLDNLVVRITDYPELEEVIRTREPLVIADVFGDALLSGVRQRLEEAKITHRSSVLFPLLRKREVVGALFLRSKHTLAHVDDRVLGMGRVIASVTAIAIGNAIEQDELLSERRVLQRDKEDADQALADLQSFMNFFEHAMDGIVVTNTDGKIQYLNTSAADIFDKEAADLHGVDFAELLSPQYHRLAQRAIRGETTAGGSSYVDLLLASADSDEVVISAAFRPLPRERDAGTVISFRDVTELREIESELRQTKEFLENLIQSSVDAIIAADIEGIVILFNRAAEQMLGITAREAVGRISISDLYPPGEAEDMMRRLRSESYGGRGRLELVRKELIAKGGDVVPVNLTASVIYEDEEEIASVAIFTDLRDRMRIEAKLSQVQRQLQLSERQSVAVELAGAAAHELNQPLTSILGYAELLKRRIGEDDSNRKPVDVISREVERMAAIVKRIGQITAYKSAPYVGGSTILDLGGPCSNDPQGEAEDGKKKESET